MLNNNDSYLSFVSVGQSLVRDDIRNYNHKDYIKIIDIIKEADIAFTNLETAIRNEKGTWPLKDAGYFGSESFVLEILKNTGFNLLSLSNNHSYDLGSSGIISTIKYAERYGFAQAGTGRNLEEASAPCYIETKKGRAALIAMAGGSLPNPAFASSRFIDDTEKIRKQSKPRPGVNPLRVDTHRKIKEKDLRYLKKLSLQLGHEEEKNSIKYFRHLKTEDLFHFYGEKFIAGHSYENIRIINKSDLKRNLKNIKKAADKADYVFVYLHQHYWDPDWQKTPLWIQDFSHKCIDAGATAFIGHGVPMLHGIEIYEKRPIFYSLGNFIFHTSNPYTDLRIWESVIAILNIFKKDVISLKLYPIILGGEESIVEKDFKRKTAPHFAYGDYGRNILLRLSKLSREFGTEMIIKENHAELVMK